MTREKTKWMDRTSFWMVDAAEEAGETVSVGHGFLATRQKLFRRTGVHLGNVG